MIENSTILLSGDLDPSECEEGIIFPCEDEIMDILTCSDSSQKKTDDTSCPFEPNQALAVVWDEGKKTCNKTIP